MAKATSVYVCTNCGAQSPAQLGRCPECGQWNTYIEETFERDGGTKSSADILNPESLARVNETQVYGRIPTGFDEFDRVLGGGLVAGSVVLLAGDPGIGKSTILLETVCNLAKDNPKKEVLYVSGEESSYQVKIRASRITKEIPENVKIVAESDVDRIVATAEANDYALVVVDSVQTMQSINVSGSWGSLAQIRETTLKLSKFAKSKHVPVVLVGHVTKEGEIAGPKILEHLVDVVLTLEGDQFGIFRILRSSKNRYGSTSEVGIFEMGDAGLREVKNPSEIFLTAREKNLPGSVIFPAMQGDRPILLEVQALVTPSLFGNPRRVATGVDYSRLQNIIAVLTKFGKLPLGTSDVVVNVAGGISVKEPAADLAIAMSILSAVKGRALKEGTVVYGELGLLGEVRNIGFSKNRQGESIKLGFKEIVSPERVKNIAQAIEILRS